MGRLPPSGRRSSDDIGEWLAQQILDFDLTSENVKTELARGGKRSSVREEAFRTILKNRTFHGGILAPGSSLIKHGENGKGISSRWYPETLARRIRDIVRIKERIEIVKGDGIAIMDKYVERRDVAFFVDPPYTAAGKRAGTRLYTHHTLDHERLFATAARLAGPFLITYDNAPEIVGLAAKHGLQTRTIPMKNTHHARMDELAIGRDLKLARLTIRAPFHFENIRARLGKSYLLLPYFGDHGG